MIIVFLGIIMFVMGLSCKYLHDDYKNYPNLYVGYKLEYAMKNKYLWEEANEYIYIPCKFVFIFSIIFTLITTIFDIRFANIVYYLVIGVIVLGPIVITEIHLRKFNDTIENNSFKD